ncbi:hypothetical protein [Rhodococcus wratislaviensis]|uniref:Condensation domain-containing protein n=1 Tax=Rhodococcus wratislaviensis NBRC 100605 TaxID=1219028 RepID=X0Q3H5_RHOWR|nr:hypothetical protein [Rhodococcus wratislaviensis]GAF50753.1 hypothetical protein RW1_095_03780 [Rhodococcus wratislaviensis NBRC 100605]
MSTHSASYRDLMRSASRMITAIGPLRLPSIGEIRDTLTLLAHAGGRHTPIGLVPTTESRRWEHRPQDFLGQIRELGPCTREEVPQLLTRLARSGASAHPLNVAVAGDFLLLDISHGLGDGRLALSLVRAVAGGRTGTPVPEWARTRDTALPLARALTRTFASSPTRVARLLESLPAAAHSPGSAEMVPWHGAPTAVVASAASGTTAELRRWRDREMPGASVSSLLFAAIARAMRSHGLTIDDKVDVLFDCRRYLPEGATVNGNFAALVRFSLSDPGDPAEMSAAIAQATASGRPLASMALSTATFRRRVAAGSAHARATHVAAEPRTRLVYSDMGEAALLADLDWTDEPGRRLVTALSEPADPASIVFTPVRRGPELDVSASLHDNVFDPELVRIALADALCDPLSLLSRRIF